MQVAEPCMSLYVPGSQCAHVWPSMPVYPLLQWQSDSVFLAAGACELGGHIVHVIFASIRTYPLLHLQSCALHARANSAGI